jgi:hypothetical protein
MLEAEIAGIGDNNFDSYLQKQRQVVTEALKCKSFNISTTDLAAMCKSISLEFDVNLKMNCCQEILSLFPIERSLLIIKGWEHPTAPPAIRNALSLFFLGIPWPERPNSLVDRRMHYYKKLLQKAINNYYL